MLHCVDVLNLQSSLHDKVWKQCDRSGVKHETVFARRNRCERTRVVGAKGYLICSCPSCCLLGNLSNDHYIMQVYGQLCL